MKKLIATTDKRLQRLIDSGICPAKKASDYAKELKMLLREVSDPGEARRESRFLKAICDPIRIRMLRFLSVREMCVCEVMVALEMTQPTASHHLGVLERAGVLKSRKEGRWVFYRVAKTDVLSVLDRIDALLTR